MTKSESRLDRWLERLSNFSTVVAAVIAGVTLLLGYQVFQQTLLEQRKTAEVQSEAAAISMLENHYNLALQYSETARQRSDKEDWFSSHALFTAETLYRLKGDNPGWRATVANIIKENASFIRKGEFHCELYNPHFASFVQEQFKDINVCGNK